MTVTHSNSGNDCVEWLLPSLNFSSASVVETWRRPGQLASHCNVNQHNLGLHTATCQSPCWRFRAYSKTFSYCSHGNSRDAGLRQQFQDEKLLNHTAKKQICVNLTHWMTSFSVIFNCIFIHPAEMSINVSCRMTVIGWVYASLRWTEKRSTWKSQFPFHLAGAWELVIRRMRMLLRPKGDN